MIHFRLSGSPDTPNKDCVSLLLPLFLPLFDLVFPSFLVSEPLHLSRFNSFSLFNSFSSDPFSFPASFPPSSISSADLAAFLEFYIVPTRSGLVNNPFLICLFYLSPPIRLSSTPFAASLQLSLPFMTLWTRTEKNSEK